MARPREARTITTLLTGRLLRVLGPDGLCQIRNLSSHGMMIETPASFTVGERVVVELRSRERLDGAIAWTEQGRAGVRFDASLPVERIFASNDTQGSPRRRRC